MERFSCYSNWASKDRRGVDVKRRDNLTFVILTCAERESIKHLFIVIFWYLVEMDQQHLRFNLLQLYILFVYCAAGKNHVHQQHLKKSFKPAFWDHSLVTSTVTNTLQICLRLVGSCQFDSSLHFHVSQQCLYQYLQLFICTIYSISVCAGRLNEHACQLSGQISS